MNDLASLPGAPFGLVLDVGGNIGEFAAAAHEAWPQAAIISFEPIPAAAAANRDRAGGRWQVEQLALSDHCGEAFLNFCASQHTASTLQEPGPGRRELLGIVDQWQDVLVEAWTLDRVANVHDMVGNTTILHPRVLLKIDVEGHELHVLRGSRQVLQQATTVLCEVQNDASLFLGSASPAEIDAELQTAGLRFAGLRDAFMYAGRVLQFDGVWTREPLPAA